MDKPTTPLNFVEMHIEVPDAIAQATEEFAKQLGCSVESLASTIFLHGVTFTLKAALSAQDQDAPSCTPGDTHRLEKLLGEER